jgi:hypothetical protein
VTPSVSSVAADGSTASQGEPQTTSPCEEHQLKQRHRLTLHVAPTLGEPGRRRIAAEGVGSRKIAAALTATGTTVSVRTLERVAR